MLQEILWIVFLFISLSQIINCPHSDIVLSPDHKVILCECSNVLTIIFHTQRRFLQAVFYSGGGGPFAHLLLLFVVLSTFACCMYSLCFERLGITVIQLNYLHMILLDSNMCIMLFVSYCVAMCQRFIHYHMKKSLLQLVY